MRGRNAAEVAEDIERQVADGVLQPGHRLPPVRALAAELSLAPNTVAAAYRRLGERGFVVGRGRSGTFVASRPPVATPLEPVLGPGLVDLARGNPDPGLLPPLPQVGAPENPVLYGDASMDETLARLAAEDLQSDGVPTDHLTVVSGALDGIERILGAHTRPGDRVALEDPAFHSVIDLVGAMGLIPVPVTIDDRGMLPEALGEALASGVTAVVHTPRGQNPFGAAITPERAADLRSLLAASPEVLVVEDDYAGVLTGAPYVTVAGDTRERWAVIRSMAKTYGPDLRIAVLAADDHTVRRVEGRQRLGPGWVSHLLQRTVATMMGDRTVASMLDEAAETYRLRRAGLVEALRERGVLAHGHSGLNVWVPVADEQAAVAGMRANGYAVRSGDRFRLRAEPGIRITTAALEVEAAPEVAAALSRVLGDGEHATRTA